MKRLPTLLVACALLVSGCGETASPEHADPAPTSSESTHSPESSEPTTAPPPVPSRLPNSTPTATPAKPKPSSGAASKARQRLAQLQIIDRQPRGLRPYVRKEFGSSWSDIDRNGCNQRDDVLRRDATQDTLKTQWQGRCPHDVLAGTWIDPYTGKTLVFTDLKAPHQSRAIQIDHVVPLAEAWRSGAHAWDYEQRRQFANTLDNLLAVDGPTNMSKGDDDPAAWRPRKGFQCSYAKRWIRVKHDWSLGADKSEIRALGEMLDYCT